jgi:hypothetical protein
MSSSVISIVVLLVLAGIGLYFFYRRRTTPGVTLTVERPEDDDVATIDARVAELDAQKKRGEITDDEHRARMAELVGDRRKFKWRRRE